MPPFFRQSQVWAIEYQYKGRTRQWLKALPQGCDAEATVRDLLKDLYGDHARLVSARPATEAEDEDFRRGRMPRNAYCPIGSEPTGRIREAEE